MFYTLMETFEKYTNNGIDSEERVVAIYDAFHLNDAITHMVTCEFRDIYNVGKTVSYYITEWEENEINGERRVIAEIRNPIFVHDEFLITEDNLV